MKAEFTSNEQSVCGGKINIGKIKGVNDSVLKILNSYRAEQSEITIISMYLREDVIPPEEVKERMDMAQTKKCLY